MQTLQSLRGWLGITLIRKRHGFFHPKTLLQWLLAYGVWLNACTTPSQGGSKSNDSVSTATPKNSHWEAMQWIKGNWQNTTKMGLYTEAWQLQNDSTLAGFAWIQQGLDTVWQENMELMLRQEKLLYKVVTPNQNESRAVVFEGQSGAHDSFVFSNPKHDFPQHILYYRVQEDSLMAIISGKQNGVERAESFPMKRRKSPLPN